MILGYYSQGCAVTKKVGSARKFFQSVEGPYVLFQKWGRGKHFFFILRSFFFNKTYDFGWKKLKIF
jgi:hypothetical protein